MVFNIIIRIIFKIIKWYVLFPIYHYKIFTWHCIINFLLSIYIYKKLYPFYDPKKEEAHKKYYVFRRLDKLNYLRLLIGLITIFWPRLILFLLCMIIMAIAVSIGKDILDPKDKPWKDRIYQIGSRIILFSLGNVIPKISLGDQEKIKSVYKKYLGPDYEISYNERFSTIISNHVSWAETYFYMYRYASGFIGKLTASKVPAIKQMGVYNQTIYLDRQNPDDRKITAEKIAKRQKDLYEGKNLTNLSIYPEGTITNGTHLIKFKRGAFMTLLPLKPMVELVDQNAECTLATGALPMHLHMVLCCCYLWNNDTFLDLPIIKPTPYMYKNYAKENEENWYTYMNVTKSIMAECAGLKETEDSFDQKLEYLSLIKGKKVKNT